MTRVTPRTRFQILAPVEDGRRLLAFSASLDSACVTAHRWDARFVRKGRFVSRCVVRDMAKHREYVAGPKGQPEENN